MREPNRTVSLRLPQGLLTRITAFSKRGLSVNSLLIEAVESHVRYLERLEIDDAFEAMATDSEYTAITSALMSEFETSDAETAALI